MRDILGKPKKKKKNHNEYRLRLRGRRVESMWCLEGENIPFFFFFSHHKSSQLQSQAVFPCYFLLAIPTSSSWNQNHPSKHCYYHALSNYHLQLKAHPPLLPFLPLLFRLPCFPILPPRSRPQALHEPQGPKYVSPPSPIFLPCFLFLVIHSSWSIIHSLASQVHSFWFDL